MANEGFQILRSVKAANDLSALQYCAVAMTVEDSCSKAGTNTQQVLGILQNDPLAGEAAQVCLFGVCRAKANGGTDIVIGDQLSSGSGGRLIKNTTAGCMCVGVALQGATNDNEIITVLVSPQFVS